MRCWVKVEHEVISRPRREQVRDLRRRSRGGEELSTWGHGVQVQTFSDSTRKYVACLSPLRLQQSHPRFACGIVLLVSRSGWLISGSVSAIVSLRKGYPTVLPFHPNRLPRKRDFTICLSPLRTTSCTAIAALEKSLRSRHGAKEPQLSTFLRIYEADISAKIHPLAPSQLGGCQIRLNTTARQMVELHPLTDDVTQKQILGTPTFAFATHRPVPVEFEAELEREQMAFAQPEAFPDIQLHDRFFDAQHPYALPDPVVGQTPLMFEDQYSVVLVQEGKVIDRFELSKHEHIIDMEELSLEVPSAEPAAEAPRDAAKREQAPAPPKSNRRVLLAVSTGHIDPHGEDTQGEGRLLVFDIDFAHYQEEVEQDAEPESTEQPAAVPMQLEAPAGGDGDVDANPSAEGGMEATAKAAAAATAREEGELDEAEASAAQLAATATHVESELGTGRRLMSVVQPKLRLVWSGFGPSTVVRQFHQYVLSTVGCTLFVYWYDGIGLEQVSFFRAQVTHLSALFWSTNVAHVSRSVFSPASAVLHRGHQGGSKLHRHCRHLPQCSVPDMARAGQELDAVGEGLRAVPDHHPRHSSGAAAHGDRDLRQRPQRQATAVRSAQSGGEQEGLPAVVHGRLPHRPPRGVHRPSSGKLIT